MEIIAQANHIQLKPLNATIGRKQKENVKPTSQIITITAND
jgi:hypothetical protein